MNSSGTRLRIAVLLVALLTCRYAVGAPEPFTVILEAEEAEVLAPAEMEARVGARGEQCVRISAEDARERTTVTHERNLETGGNLIRRGEVRFRPDFPHAGNYTVWVRLQWHCVCGKSLRIQTSGTTALGDSKSLELDMERFTSNERPLVWHWVKAGTFEMAAGPQEVKIIQQGHLVRVDAMAISADPGYLPPGYVDENATFTLSELPSAWRKTAGTRTFFPFDTREWSDFSLSMTISNAPTLRESAVSSVGFSLDGARNGYELEILSGLGDKQSIELYRSKEGERTSLGKAAVLYTPGSPYTLLVHRAGADIVIFGNGVELLSVDDDAYGSGMIGVVPPSEAEVTMHDIEVRALSHIEIAAWEPDETVWTTELGRWNSSELEGAGTETPVLYPGSSGRNILRIAGAHTDMYDAEASLSLQNGGAAGLVFDYWDPENFKALVLDGGGNDPAGQISLKALTVDKGKFLAPWCTDFGGTVGQWYNIRIARDLESVSFSIGDRTFGPFSCERNESADGVGFFAEGADALFASAVIRARIAPAPMTMDFEPGVGLRSRSFWRAERGIYYVGQHPGRLEMEPAQGESSFLLNYALDLPARAELVVLLAKDRSKSFSRPAAGEIASLPALPMPVLPDDPRFGIVVQSTGAPQTVIRATLDTGTRSDIQITLNDTTILHQRVDSPKERTTTEQAYYLRIERGEATFGMEGGWKETITLPDEAQASGVWKAALIGENLTDGEVLSISQVRAKPLFPALGSGNELPATSTRTSAGSVK